MTEESTEEQAPGPLEDLQQRLQKLAQKGHHNPLMLVNLRLDLVTQLLVPDSLVPTLEQAWQQVLEQYVNDLETQANRADLLEGVRQ